MRRSGKASTLRRTLHTARRPEIVRHCSRALPGWLLSVDAVVPAFHVVATSARIRALPRSPGVPVEASLSLTLRGLRSLTRVTSLVLLVNQHFSFCDHGRAHSIVEHTSAVSTVTVHDSCDQPLSSPRSTSSRCPFITGCSCSSSSPGVLLPLSAQSLTGDQSSRRVQFTRRHRYGDGFHQAVSISPLL